MYTAIDDLRLSLTGTKDKGPAYGFLYYKDTLKTLLKGKKQIRRILELFQIIKAKRVDVSRLDDRFFAVVSLYLCEEKDFNIQLLDEELRRLN